MFDFGPPEHLLRSSRGRSFYRSTVKVEEATAHQVLTANKGIVPKNNSPCSLQGKMHYSYDYAQVHYPSNPLQPGPIYFKTPRKCAIFGVCCEAIPPQVNFLVDVSVLTGKGANSTISLVHYYFGKFGLGITDSYIHADNCSGQNKNNYFLWYYAWRIIVGLHWNILYSFLVAATQSSLQTGVLVWLSRQSEKLLFRIYSSWPVRLTTRLSKV